jgi:CRP-like cAMP-binding protein
MQVFRNYIEKYVQVTDADWSKISGSFEQRVISKDELLLKDGQICRHLYFLESGLMRYFISKDGLEVTKFFTDAPYCFTSQVSFTAEKAATESIQAVEASLVWQITLREADHLLELKAWNTFTRKLIQEVQFYTESILQEIQTETAEDRYKKMLLKNGALVGRIPLKYLASYLGIAPQSLSRIRKKLTKSQKLT